MQAFKEDGGSGTSSSSGSESNSSNSSRVCGGFQLSSEFSCLEKRTFVLTAAAPGGAAVYEPVYFSQREFTVVGGTTLLPLIPSLP